MCVMQRSLQFFDSFFEEIQYFDSLCGEVALQNQKGGLVKKMECLYTTVYNPAGLCSFC